MSVMLIHLINGVQVQHIAKPTNPTPMSSTQSTNNNTPTAPVQQTRSWSGRTIKPTTVINYDRLGGVAESEIVAYPITDVNRSHLANLICPYHSSFGSIICATDVYVSKDCWAHLANLDEITPRHFEYIFKVRSKKDPDTLWY